MNLHIKKDKFFKTFASSDDPCFTASDLAYQNYGPLCSRCDLQRNFWAGVIFSSSYGSPINAVKQETWKS